MAWSRPSSIFTGSTTSAAAGRHTDNTALRHSGFLGSSSSSFSRTDSVHACSVPDLPAFHAAAAGMAQDEVCDDDLALAGRTHSYTMPAHTAVPDIFAGSMGAHFAELRHAAGQMPADHVAQAHLVTTPRCPVAAVQQDHSSSGGGGGSGAQQQQQQLLLELAGTMTAQVCAATAADETHTKLQLLEQLQSIISQQQHQLQLQLQSQHRGSMSGHTPTTTMGLSGPSHSDSARAAGHTAVLHDSMPARDQGSARGMFGGQQPLAGRPSSHPGSLQSSAPVSIQQQRHRLLHEELTQQPSSSCGFDDTPTALAALPPGLLEEDAAESADAAASVISQPWAAASKHCGGGGSSASGNRTAVQFSGKNDKYSSSSSMMPSSRDCAWPPGPAELAEDRRRDAHLAVLQQQLQQAIESLENLHIAGTTLGAAGAAAAATTSSAVSSAGGGKALDWDAVGALLRSESGASRSSGINRSGSGITTDSSASSMLWLDSAAAGAAMLPAVLGLQGMTTSGGTLLHAQCPGVDAALQRTLSSVSCSSATSGCGTPKGTPGAYRATGCASRLGSRSTSCSGGRSNSTHDTAATQSDALTSSAPGEAHVVARSSSSGSRAGRSQQTATVDSLLQQCAPKWAKAGWNPKAAVKAAAPASKGTGAFVRLTSSSDSGTSSATVAGTGSTVTGSAGKGTGAFIPPAVRAALAASAGLT